MTLTEPAQIGAAAERALRAHQVYRYYAWEIRNGAFVFFEHPVHLECEKRLEGKYDLAGAVDALPSLLPTAPQYEALWATGTEAGTNRLARLMGLAVTPLVFRL